MTTFPSQYSVLIGSASTSTSGWFWTGDYRLLTMSFASSGSLGPSRFTVEGSNEDGFSTSLPASTAVASLISGVNMIGATPGMVTFDPPGWRWTRVTVAPANQSVASTVTITICGTRL